MCRYRRGEQTSSSRRRTGQAITVLVIAAAMAPAVPAAAASRVVAAGGERCPGARYASVQAAVADAAPGDTVVLCPGVHREAVTIPAGKDGLRLRARRAHQAILAAPASHSGAILRIGASDVEVSRLRIAGPFGTAEDGCPPASTGGVGIHVAPGVTGAEIVGNVVEQITDPAGGQCPSGTDLASGYAGTAIEVRGRALVAANVIQDHATTGVDVGGEGAFAEVRDNVLTAAPRAAGALATRQAGVRVGRGASADVARNDVAEHRGAPGDARDGIGILLAEVGGPVRIVNNNADANDTALELSRTDAPVAILSNSIFSNSDLGIRLRDVRDATVTGNRISGGGGGIHVDAGSAGNRLERNDARGNGGTDCVDESTGGAGGAPAFGTANAWLSNRGDESAPAGLCTPG